MGPSQHEGVSVTDPKKIQETIYGFYKNLFGSQPERKVCLAEGAWARQHRLTPGDNEELLKLFTSEEVKETVFEMKEEVAPGPDGFGVSFYKKHWGTIKAELMDLVNDFFRDRLDLERLNYGVITLVPKSTDANKVKQFRPICLLNVSFKIFTRLLYRRISRFAATLISLHQTAFNLH
jgi:hypothetical protein